MRVHTHDTVDTGHKGALMPGVTSHANREIGVGGFHREIIFKRRKTMHFVIFGNSAEIRVILISDS